MSKITRLPTQHPSKPHCANCKGDLPNLNGMELSLSPSDVDLIDLIAFTLHVNCRSCGAPWDLRKTCKVAKDRK